MSPCKARRSRKLLAARLGDLSAQSSLAPRPDPTPWGQQVSSRPGRRASVDPQFLALSALRLPGSWPCNPRFCSPRPLVFQYRDCPTPPVFSLDFLPGSSRVPYLPFPSFLAPGYPDLRPVTFLFLGPQTPGSQCAAVQTPSPRLPACETCVPLA